jgi:predicted transposase/invertase (TIGR01784 family)
VVDKDKRQKEKEAYLRKCAEAIRDMPVDKAKKSYIVTTAEILAGIIYDEEVIEKIFSEVIGMSILEESKVYKNILEKGKKEKSIEIVRELLKEGMDINKIAQITKLPVEEIKKLLN